MPENNKEPSNNILKQVDAMYSKIIPNNPLPVPSKNEQENGFITRCMIALKDEFTDEVQRLAISKQQFRKK